MNSNTSRTMPGVRYQASSSGYYVLYEGVRIGYCYRDTPGELGAWFGQIVQPRGQALLYGGRTREQVAGEILKAARVVGVLSGRDKP